MRKRIGDGEGQPHDLFSGNGRVARLARWLREAPVRREVDQLVLEIKGEDGYERIQSWPRESVSSALAVTIDAMVTDAANELGSYLSARVSWWDSERGAAWSTFALRVQPDGMAGQQAFSGEGTSVTIQLQRNLERSIAMHLSGIGEGVALARDQAQDARERARRAEYECDRLRERVNALEDEKAALVAKLRETEDDLAAAMELAEETTAKVEESRKESESSGALLKLVEPFLGGMKS